MANLLILHSTNLFNNKSCQCDILSNQFASISTWGSLNETRPTYLQKEQCSDYSPHYKVLTKEPALLYTQLHKTHSTSAAAGGGEYKTRSLTCFHHSLGMFNDISFSFAHQSTPEEAIADYKNSHTYPLIAQKTLFIPSGNHLQPAVATTRSAHHCTHHQHQSTVAPPTSSSVSLLRPNTVIIGETQEEMRKRKKSTKQSSTKQTHVVAHNSKQLAPKVMKPDNSSSYMKMFWVSAQAMPLVMSSRSLDLIKKREIAKKPEIVTKRLALLNEGKNLQYKLNRNHKKNEGQSLKDNHMNNYCNVSDTLSGSY